MREHGLLGVAGCLVEIYHALEHVMSAFGSINATHTSIEPELDV